jgi:hypothetical protein
MRIQEQALLVSVTLHYWRNRKLDKRLTAKVNKQTKAKKGTIGVTKDLVDCAEVKQLKTLQGHIRNNIVDHLTVPWGDHGQRLITVELLDRFEDELAQAVLDWDTLLHDLKTSYPIAVANSADLLGTAHNPADYPTTDQIIAKYGIEVKYCHLPDSGDIRVDLPQSKIDKIVNSVDDQVTAGIKESTTRIHKRLTDKLGALIEKLSGYTVDAKTGKATGNFAPTLVTNLTDLVDILPALNVTGDPALAQATDEIVAQLGDLKPEALKTNESYRKDTIAKAKTIASSLEGLY